MIEEYAGGNPLRALLGSAALATHARASSMRPRSRWPTALTQELELLPMVRAVESPTTAALLVPATDGFAVRRFVENGEIAPDAEALGQRAVEDRFWRNNYISAKTVSVGVALVQTIRQPPADN